jgi:mono/diheme cytochrome c family protein
MEDYYDARPTTFDRRKLVVKDRWHPSLPAKVESVFSPWMHADSLVAIEFVQADAWFAQFDVEHAPETHRGFDVFRQSCAFCHGARGVGARFGSDLVRPRPLYQYQRPFARFYYHVTFRAPDFAQRGFMMPALSYMTESDARAVWLWLQAIARWNVLPYRPKDSSAQGKARS